MILYSIQCTRCSRMEPHGLNKPDNPDTTVMAREMRMSCKERYCSFTTATSEATDCDLLRLGLRPERIVA